MNTAPPISRRTGSLRVRLLAAIAAVVALALVAAGALLLESTRADLVARVDESLRASLGAGMMIGDGPGGHDPGGRRVAIVVLDATGAVLASAPSGFLNRPDPLPDVADVSAALAAGEHVETGVIGDRRAVDGHLRYRALLESGRLNTTIVIAAPLADVDAALATLLRDLLLIGLAALVAVVILGWLILRGGLRPLEAMSATADEIAAGDLTARARQPHDGTEVGRLATAFDRMLDTIAATLAEERTARAAKEASEIRLRRFVSDASHELRTPLTTVRGYAELYAAGGLPAGPELDAAMARIAGESVRMADLVDDLLLLARLDQGRPLRSEPVDLRSIVEEAVADARALEPDRPFETDLTETGVAVVAGDVDRLRQVVANLLANVRVHTTPAAAARIALSVEAGSAVLRVIDHGPGVDSAVAPRVFDRFFRVDDGRSRDRGGAGLGLSIVDSIVTALGGTVELETTPGGGATFVVRLPIQPGGISS